MGFKVRWCTVMVSRVKDLGVVWGFGLEQRVFGMIRIFGQGLKGLRVGKPQLAFISSFCAT